MLLKLLRWAESEIARTGTGTGEAAPAAASYEIPDRDGMERVRAQARATLATIGGET